MRILVTGSNGFIGKHVIGYLVNNFSGGEIYAVDTKDAPCPYEVNFINLDIMQNPDDHELYDTLGRPDILIHTAWDYGQHGNDPVNFETLAKDYVFLTNMIDSGCKNITVTGTVHEVGYMEGMVSSTTPCNPINLFGIAKNALRQSLMSYISDKDVMLKWLRIFEVTGDEENNPLFARIIQMEKEGKQFFPLASGDNQYDFIDVDVLSEQIVKAAIQDVTFGIINTCTGEPVALRDKIATFLRVKDLKIRPEYGALPVKEYDSPVIYGDATIINGIVEHH